MAEKNLKARIVHKHDIEANWLLATGFTPKQGEIIVYDIDDTHSCERMKIGDGVQNVNNLPFYDDGINDKLTTLSDSVADLIALLNNAHKLTSVTMLSSGWQEGDSGLYSQVVACNGVSANSKLDLQPTPVQIVELQDTEISLMATNTDGVVTIYAIGNKPIVDYTMDILITEVTVV